MGRKKIEIKLIHQEAVRRATFDKRRIGVIKKAMELSILCDCEVSMTIRRRDVQDLSIYASDPYDDIISQYQRFRGKHVLFTNDHISELIPGKANSRESGYLVNKKACFSERYMYKGAPPNENISLNTIYPQGNGAVHPGMVNVGGPRMSMPPNVRSMFTMNPPMFRVPNFTVMPQMNPSMMKMKMMRPQMKKIPVAANNVCSPSLVSLYEVLKDDSPNPPKDEIKKGEDSKNDTAESGQKRSFEQVQDEMAEQNDEDLFNRQIFEFDLNEPPKKKIKMETDHDGDETDSDDIKIENESSHGSSSMSGSVEMKENRNDFRGNVPAKVHQDSDDEIEIKIEQEM